MLYCGWIEAGKYSYYLAQKCVFQSRREPKDDTDEVKNILPVMENRAKHEASFFCRKTA